MTNGQYTVRPEAMRSAVGNVGGIILSAMNVVLDLESLIVPPTSFATVGVAVAGENAAMHAQQITSLTKLLRLLQDINGLMKQCADDYDSADQEVARSFGGSPTSAHPGSTLWSSSAGSDLAQQAMTDGAGGQGDPHDVGNVLRYLNDSHLTVRPVVNTFTNAGEFADWLDHSPHNQTELGVVGVYAGGVRNLGDVPGGIHAGDIVVADTHGDPSTSVVGIVGTNGQLFNHGAVHPDFSNGGTIRVYRPTPAALQN